MKPTLTLLFFALSGLTGYCQNELKNWYFGRGTDGITFINNTAQKLSNKVNGVGYEGMIVVNDPLTGDLLFYSDGERVINKNHQVMVNGSGLTGHFSGAQCVQSCPVPGTCVKKFYLFTNSAWDNTSGSISYSIVDFTNNPLGEVTSKNTLFWQGPSDEAMCLVNKPGTYDYWLIANEFSTAKYNVWPLTTAGIGTPVSYTFSNTGSSYQMNYSKASQKLSITGYGNKKVTLINFNDNTGVLSNEVQIGSQFAGTAASRFSPDGTKLYVGIFSNSLHQYNFTTASWINMNTCCHPHDLKMGPDGRMYFIHTYYAAQPLGVIDFPNLSAAGNACNYRTLTFSQGFTGEVRRFPETVILPEPPTAGSDMVTLNGSSVVIPVLNNDSDPLGGSLIIDAIIRQPVIGTAIISGNNIIYTAGPNRCSSTDTLIYRIANPTCATDTAIVIINLPQSVIRVPKQDSFCSGDIYRLPSGRVVNTPGIYIDTVRYLAGCDSLISTIVLTKTTSTEQASTATICTGQTYTLPGGSIVSASGLYRDTLSSTSGCDSIINTTLTIRPPLSTSISSIALICEGGSATLTATASAGNGGPYTFNWGSAGTGNTITVSPATNTKYLLTVTDGCTVLPAKDSVTITVVPKPDASFATSASAICAPASISFSSVATGVRYKWNFGTGVPGDTSAIRNPIFTYTQPGNYIVTLTVTTPGDCTSTSTQSINAGVTPQGNFAQPAPICAGGSSSFTGTVNNPTGIIWNWSFGNGNTSAVQNPPGQTYTTAGNYVVRLIVTNVAGCADTTDRTIVVAPIPVPGLNNATETICLGASVILRAQGGGTYDWSPSLWLSDAASASPVATPITTTRYKVIVTSAAGCKATDSVLIQVTQPFSMIAPRDTFVCAGASVQLQATGALRYLWSGQGLSLTTSANPIAKLNDTAVYTVTGYGTDNCFTQTATFTINVIPTPFIEAGRDTTVSVGSSFVLLPQYGTAITQYRWSPDTYLSCSDCPNPVTTPRASITYTVSVKNAGQCEASDTRIIKLLCNNESIFVPNTFTPNGDGANDIFYPRGEGIKSVRFLRVYNRWGQLVFERLNFNTNDRSQGWDGTFKGEKLAPDVYVYSLGMVCDNGQVIDTKGNVMIVR
ncbi:MAG: PKD domain-containing protein [Bacteroidota bacterium]